MGAKLHKVNPDGTLHGWMFRCPGCELDPLDSGLHCPTTGWTFNGDMERPTFGPSILVRWKAPEGEKVCHSYVRDGRIEFLGDCTHALAGQTVDLPDWERSA
jgi:hypothetical protein